MKKYILLVIILLTSSLSIAQKKVNKSQRKNSNTQEILARPPGDIIVDPNDPLDPIDPIDPIDPVDSTPMIPTTPGYHDTQGKFEVSNNGQATYTLPIALPPSIQSVGPTINLVYSSGQMGGIAGQGWSINSISNIARIATRKDIDGFVDGVDFDNNDKLALDGQRLILVSGSYWTDGSIYKSEVLSNSKIELIGSGASLYFIVTAPDGSRSWYGNFDGQNAADLTAFYIVRFEDTNGNFITYHYNRPYNKALCINEIKFSANVNGLTNPLNRIKFNYVLAKRVENVYIKGVKHEKVELLRSIVVYTNNLQFKKYVLTHDIDPQLGYERVVQIQEINADNELANPVIFQYPTTTMDNTNSEMMTSYSNNLNFNDVELSGDFDGDGRLDFVTENGLYRNLFNGSSGQAPISFNIPEKKKLIATNITANKLNQFQSIVAVNPTLSQTEFKVYNFNGSSLGLNYTKTININNAFTVTETENSIMSSTQYSGYDIGQCDEILQLQNKKKDTEYYEGDFNGDGISEVLIINAINQHYHLHYEHRYDNYNDFTSCVVEETNDGFQTLLVDLNPNSSNLLGSNGFVDLNTNELTDIGKKIIADFDGDGKSDILVINEDNKTYKVYTINQLAAAPWHQIQIIGQGTILEYDRKKQLLFGDFNGDGKTDIMLPNGDGSNSQRNDSQWHIYYSNPNPIGGTFFVKESHNIVEYWPNTGGYYNTQTHFNNYYALDTNGDGKSDLVRVWRKHYKPSWTINDHNTQWSVTTFANNIGNSTTIGGRFTLDYSSTHNHDSDSPDLMIPIVSNYKYKGLDKDLVMVHNHYNRVIYIKFNKDVSEDIRLNKIISSGGNIVDQIEYKAMEPSTTLNNGQGALNDLLYSSSNSVNYPNVEIKKLPTNFLVSKITNTTEGITKHQDFKYHGLVVNLHGLGTIGFNKTARSAWYQNPNAKRLWNVYENDPQIRGALIRSYSQLFNNGNSFTFVNSGNPVGIVNSTTNTFHSYTSNGSYYMALLKQTTNDFITGVSTDTDYIYDNLPQYSTNYIYLLPTTVTIKNYTASPANAVGTKVTTTVFDNNPSGLGANYHIGRPLEVTSTTSAYGDTSTSKEIFTYSGNKLIKTQKKGNTLDNKFLVEEFMYNSVGNVTKKTLSSTGYNATESFTPRVTEFTYDPTERFVKTSKDIEGLVATNVSFHPVYGIVTETLSPYGLTSKVFVDHWGKVFKTTDYLGKNTTISYLKSGNEYITSKSSEDGSSSVAISDALGRPKKSGQKNLDGSWSYKAIEYDFLGRAFRESEPFSNGNPTQWKTTTFDDYGRQMTVVYPSGLTTTLTYNGLTVTGNDGTKTTSSSKNANGHVISSSDNGGIINFQYYADGNLKNSNYNGTVVSMEYDEWGRKKKLNDPSAGEYTYTYNALGELLTEITPNGTTTNVYDAFGNIDYTTIVGTNTNSKTKYTYDSTTKLLTNLKYEDFNNGNAYDEYSYMYDNFKRLYSTTENKYGNSTKTFKRQTVFDAFGRSEKEYYEANAAGKQSAKWVKNTYKNGYHWQIIDDATNQMLWQSNTVNARGQLTSANLGNGIAITNSYDDFGFPTQFKHDKVGVGNTMTLNTTFESQRGNLTSRYNSLFNRTENFQYDALDRLTHYINALGQQVQQIYESDGRIKENNIGRYNYSNSSKKYQNTTIDPTPESKAYYENRVGIFNDGMETRQGWTNNQPTIFSFDESVKRSGNVSLKITNTSTTEKVVNADTWISIDNAVPTQYTYSAWVRSDGTNPQAEIFLFMKTEQETGNYTQFNQKVLATNSNWMLIEQTVLVPANIKKLNIRLDNNGFGNLWFDDVRIRKTSDSDNGNRSLYISYNTWKSPYQIEESNVDKISFTYNYMNNRSEMYYGGLQTNKYQRQYNKSYAVDGTMEVKINQATNDIEFITYIGGDGYTAPVVLKSDGTTQNYLYLHRDYQGSIVAITNQAGQVVEKRLYDAWGEVIKVQDGQGNVLNGFKVLDRGYTGHEHLHSVGLIHMNGRLYDPKLHRFLQPDNYIQDPYNTQNYNRYAYVLNNPLKYTDPSGEELISFTAAVLIGAFIAATTYTLTALLADVPFTAGGFLKATIIGAASAAATYGIGTFAQTMPLTDKIVFQAFAHGTSQAFFTGIQGGDPLVGFASGALSSVASSLWAGVGPDNGGWHGIGGCAGNSDVGMVSFGVIMGGAGASLTGGNFWQGAATGLVVSGLNHAAHAMMQKDPVKQPWDTNGDGKLQKSEADNWWLNGKGKPITVDNRLIDWSGLDVDEIDALKVGSSFAIETHEAFMDLEYETAATYGGTSFKKTGQFTIEVQDQKYHYNYRPNNGPKNIIRNIMTRIGEPVGQMPGTGALYTGQDYMIHYTNRSISVFDLL